MGSLRFCLGSAIALVGMLVAPNFAVAQLSGNDYWLSRAALDRNVEELQEWLNKGAKVNTKDEVGNSPLHRAALQGRPGTMELLLKAGADPNAINNDGETPLHRAIAGDGNLERVKRLVEVGAKLDIADKDGVTPVRLAAIRGLRPVYEWLLAAAGGKEPEARGRNAPEAAESGRPTAELIATLSAIEKVDQGSIPKDRNAFDAAQKELVRRGGAVMPEILRAIEAGAPIECFYGVFQALGPKAEEAVPLLAAQLKDQNGVFGAALIIERMKPGSLGELPEARKQEAAEAIYKFLVGNKIDVMHGFYLDVLSMLDKNSAVVMLRLLKHPDAKYRRLVASHLARRPIPDSEIEAEIVKLSRDEDEAVRKAAVRALAGNVTSRQEARRALLAVIHSPPRYDIKDEKAIADFGEWNRHAEEAARSLVSLGSEAIEDFIPMLTPMEAPQRLPAIAGLVRIGAPAVPRLIGLLSNDDQAVAVSASVALNRIGSPAAPALAEAVSTGNEQVRQHAIGALWWIGRGAKVALPSLLEVAGSDQNSHAMRFSAARAALKVEPDCRESKEIAATLPLVMKMLDQGSFQEQGLAAEVLGSMGAAARDALPLLRKRMVIRSEPAVPGGKVQVSERWEMKGAISKIELWLGEEAKKP